MIKTNCHPNKTVAIADNCQYTIKGLLLLCNQHPNWRVIAVAKTPQELSALAKSYTIDLLICGMSTQLEGIPQLFNVPRYRVGCTILLTDKPSPILYKTFLTAGFNAVFSKQASLAELTEIFEYSIYFQRKMYVKNRQQLRYLPQEQDVLMALLKGEKPNDIADMMGISYRTVSRYKRSGLKRIGVKSLNEILACLKPESVKSGLSAG
ncbi:response regulator transcription factor [Enterobacter hormaechei]|uniref:response regulator transcription factor n=1 Tax=Enterobacter hormaechei TaxID=158836 RepID=UPI00254BCAD5|nr:LuxR C-terminal-related transcriptional regulator [Enterobacter hormaechei]MDK9637839.1 LuxR C-terminal-related transcriptional regulator [Enterobacter hormaechei]